MSTGVPSASLPKGCFVTLVFASKLNVSTPRIKTAASLLAAFTQYMRCPPLSHALPRLTARGTGDETERMVHLLESRQRVVSGTREKRSTPPIGLPRRSELGPRMLCVHPPSRASPSPAGSLSVVLQSCWTPSGHLRSEPATQALVPAFCPANSLRVYALWTDPG